MNDGCWFRPHSNIFHIYLAPCQNLRSITNVILVDLFETETVISVRSLFFSSLLVQSFRTHVTFFFSLSFQILCSVFCSCIPRYFMHWNFEAKHICFDHNIKCSNCYVISFYGAHRWSFGKIIFFQEKSTNFLYTSGQRTTSIAVCCECGAIFFLFLFSHFPHFEI